MKFNVLSDSTIQIIIEPSTLNEIIKSMYSGLVEDREVIYVNSIESPQEIEDPFYKLRESTKTLYELVKKEFGTDVWIYSDNKKLKHLIVEADAKSIDNSFRILISRGEIIEAEYYPNKNQILRFKILK
jgi:hypothetical protein